MVLKFVLAPVFSKLFELVYSQCTILAQWLVADSVPVCKNKGLPKDIENYRPIADLSVQLQRPLKTQIRNSGLMLG
jgi:hypothetical protein